MEERKPALDDQGPPNQRSPSCWSPSPQLHPLAGRAGTRPAPACYPGCHSELAANWLLARDPGGLPPMALPEPHHGCLAEVVRSRRPDWPLLQVPGLWDPQCLTGFPWARIRLQGTDMAATFPAAVGLASSLLPNARASVVGVCPGDWGAEAAQLRGSASTGCPSAGSGSPQVWGGDQGQAQGFGLFGSTCPIWLFPVCLWSACV